jgi:hypothetical protein
MLVIWLGAGLFIAGILLLAAQPIWRDRLSGKRPQSAPPSNGTLDLCGQPPAWTSNWPADRPGRHSHAGRGYYLNPDFPDAVACS